MHGTIFTELEKFVGARLGPDAWSALKSRAGVAPEQTYDPLESYPDEELTALVVTASEITGLPAAALLEDFDKVLAIAGLTVAGEKVTRGGRVATAEDCRAYKHAVRDVYGATTYAFTKVNFVLGGCTCPDCLN